MLRCSHRHVPYTLSHPAFALPFRALGIPTAGLVIGSMTPDVPLWAGAVGLGRLVEAAGLTYAFTHSPLGVVTACLAFGLVLWMLWLLLRAPLHDALPSRLRHRLPAPLQLRSQLQRPGDGLRLSVGLSAGLIVGAASHVGLDELTHKGRWAHTHLPWFADTHLGLTGAKWAQYTGTLGGAAVLGSVILWQILRRRPPAGPEALVASREQAARLPGRSVVRARSVVRVSAVLGVVAAAGWTLLMLLTRSLPVAAFQSATSGVLIVIGALALGSVCWHAFRSRALSSPPEHPRRGRQPHP